MTLQIILCFVLTILFVTWNYQVQLTECKIIGAATIPHGDFAYDPSLVNYENGSSQLHDACISIGKWIINEMKPDLIFLSTPHGMALDVDFLIYKNSNESGYAIVGQDLHNNSYPGYKVNLSIHTNTEIADKFVSLLKYSSKQSTVNDNLDNDHLTKDSISNQSNMMWNESFHTKNTKNTQDIHNNNNNNNVSGILGFADSLPLPISWGEILPIKYLQNALPNNDSSLLPNFLIFSQPLRRYNHSVEMIDELLNLGGIMYDIFERNEYFKDLNIFLIISADLAHTHYYPQCMPYGYCSCAEPFDIAVNKWASLMNRTELIVNAAYQQSIGAMSCGFTGLVLLQGVFDQSEEYFNYINHHNRTLSSQIWVSDMQANYHPTYYGMMAANFTKVD